MKNDTKSQVHQNTPQANAYDVKLRNEMQRSPNDNDNMAMKDSFLEELGRKLQNSWITNQTSQLQHCQSYQPTAYQPVTIAEPQRVIPWQTDMDITKQMVLETLQSLKPSKSPGPDGLHPKVLLEIAAQIANPLCIMFRASLQTGLITDTWKLAHVTPIYKKGKNKIKKKTIDQ